MNNPDQGTLDLTVTPVTDEATIELADKSGAYLECWMTSPTRVCKAHFNDAELAEFVKLVQIDILEQARVKLSELDCAHRCGVGQEIAAAIEAIKSGIRNTTSEEKLNAPLIL